MQVYKLCKVLRCLQVKAYKRMIIMVLRLDCRLLVYLAKSKKSEDNQT